MSPNLLKWEEMRLRFPQSALAPWVCVLPQFPCGFLANNSLFATLGCNVANDNAWARLEPVAAVAC